MELAVFTHDEAQALVRRDEDLDAAVRRVATLDFFMLRSKLAADKGWTAETCDQIEDLYRRFLALCARYPERTICPTAPVDEFWHAHILDTSAYARDCEAIFGRFLHHYPYFGLRGPEDRAQLQAAFSESVDLFIVHFGIDPTAGDAAARSCRPQNCP
jgi:hypothetical protein